MLISISTDVEYVWYVFEGQRGMTLTNAKTKRSLRNGDTYGLRQLRNKSWNLVFPDDVKSIFKIQEKDCNRLTTKSKQTKIKVKNQEPIRPKDVKDIDTVIIRGRWDSDRFRPARPPKNEVQVKGDGSDVQGDGIDTKNYQWRVLVQDQEIPTKRGFKMIRKGTWIGLRFIKESQGGKVVCRDGFYYNVDTPNFDSLVLDSRLLPKARWPDMLISPEMVVENRRNARQDYLKQKREEDAKEAAIRRAKSEEEKAKAAEKKAKADAEKAKAKAAEEEFMRNQAENKVKEHKDTVTTLKSALDSATKKRKTVKPKEDYHEEDLDDEPDDIGDDDSEQDDGSKKPEEKDKDKSAKESKPSSDKDKKSSTKEDKADEDGSEEDDSEEEDDSDGSESDGSEEEDDGSESEDPDDDDLEDQPEKDPEATKKLSKALRGEKDDDDDLGDEDLGDEEDMPDEDESDKSKEDDPDDSDSSKEDDDEDAKKADEEDKKTKNRVGDGKSEEGQVVVFNADTKDKDKYVVLSVDQHPNHDHLLVYRLYKLDSDDDTVKEVRINKQRGQKLTDLCKVVKEVNEKELDALQSKTKDYEVDKKPIKS